jgi:Pre ATP-grasp domain/PGM1 C-terminal domain
MTTLHIANSRTDDMVGDLALQTDIERRIGGGNAQRVAWFARDGDVLVLPWAPEDVYLDYVAELTGTRRSSLRLVVPPSGAVGADILSPDRLAHEGFREELKVALTDKNIREVAPIYADSAVVALARALGVEEMLPGHRFSGQGGSALVNSKAVFRAVAGGIGVPLAPGAVVTGRRDAEDAIDELLTAGHPVMLKQEYQAGGFGNEILSPVDGVRPTGAQRVVVLSDRRAVEEYLSERWKWLTGGRHNRLIVERYFPDSVPLYVEFLLSDVGVDLIGHGEMLTAPVVVGVVSPAPALTPSTLAELVDNGRRLCEPFRVMGYRGVISPDAFLTPQGELLFSETNGRITGSTHIHTAIGERLVGPEYLGSRVLLERGGWKVPSFGAAVDRLVAAGLAFDPVTRTGVVLVGDFQSANGTVRYCVVADDLESVDASERRLMTLFTKIS